MFLNLFLVLPGTVPRFSIIDRSAEFWRTMLVVRNRGEPPRCGLKAERPAVYTRHHVAFLDRLDDIVPARWSGDVSHSAEAGVPFGGTCRGVTEESDFFVVFCHHLLPPLWQLVVAGLPK